MRFARKNKRHLWYANFIDSEIIYQLDDNGDKIVVDTIDGIDYYEELGQSEPHYTDATPFDGTFKETGGEVEPKPYGLDLGDYDAVLVLPTNVSPIDEKSLIWVDIEPTVVSRDEADYYVTRKSKGISTTYYALKRVQK